MTVLRLDARSSLPAPLGAVVVALGTVTLCRRDGCAYAVVSDGLAQDAVRVFAFAGIAAVSCEAEMSPPRDLLAARGVDLTPLPSGLAVFDVLRIERLPLGRATRETLRRRWCGLLPPDDLARARCRSLLRDEDALVAWDRRVWGSRAALRSSAAKHVLRPIVFDRDDGPLPLRGRARASEDPFGHWLWS